MTQYLNNIEENQKSTKSKAMDIIKGVFNYLFWKNVPQMVII